MTGILAAFMRLPKAAIGGIGVAAVGSGVFAASLLGGGPDASATLEVLAGTVEVDATDGGSFRAARDGEVVRPVATVRTGADGRAALNYFDGSITRLDHDTTFSLRELSGRAGSGGSRVIRARQPSGRTFNRVAKLTGSKSRVDVETPNATASVRGTEYVVEVLPDGSEVLKVFSGAVLYTTASGEEVLVEAGHKVAVSATGELGEIEELTPADIDGWKRYNDCLDRQANDPSVADCGGDTQNEEQVNLVQGEPTTRPDTGPPPTRVTPPRPNTAAIQSPPTGPEPEPQPQTQTEPEPAAQPQQPAQQQPTPVSPGGVVGLVTDPAGASVAGAVVTISGQNGNAGSQTTGSNGAFAFDGLGPGAYTLRATASGYHDASRSVTVPSGQTVTANITMGAEPPDPGGISGTVTDTNGDPITDATVSLDGGSAVPVDADGSFGFANLAPRSYSVSANAPGHVGHTQTVDVGPGQTTTLDFVLEQQPPETGAVAGTVRDETGAPISGGAVSLDGGAAQPTAPDGSYSFGGLAPGPHALEASAPGFTAVGTTVDVVAGQTVTRDFVLGAAPGSVRGSVLDDADPQQPIAGARVLLGRTDGQVLETSSLDDGSYEFSSVPPGSYDLSATKDEYRTNNYAVEVVPGGLVVRDITLFLDDDIEGFVRDRDTGAPIMGAVVSVDGTSVQSRPTPEDGSYALKGLSPSSTPYSVTADHPDYEAETRSVVVEPNQTAQADFALEKTPGGIFGLVVDARTGSEPIAGATVTVLGTDLMTESGPDGAYQFSRVSPGDYTVETTAEGYFESQVGVTVVKGVATEANFSLEPRPGAIEVSVTDGDGVAVAGAEVTLSGIGTQTTDSDGRTTFADVPAGGPYTVGAGHPDYSERPTADVEVGPGQTVAVPFSLGGSRPGTVEVTVTDSGGHGVSGADVSLTDFPMQTTDSDGRTTFVDVPAGGPYAVSASHPHYEDEPTTEIEVGPGETVPVALSVGGLKPGSITVEVTGFGGTSVNAKVSLDGGAEIEIGADGTHTFSDVPAGSHTLSASHEDYEPEPIRDVNVSPGASQTEAFVLTPKPGEINVEVTGFGGQPVDALVSLDGNDPASTGADGVHTFAGVETGSHTVRAQNDDYETEDARSVELAPNGNETVSFSLDPKPGSVSGVVVDAETEEPIDGASVSLDDGAPTTAVGGEFMFDDVAPGEHTVRASTERTHAANNVLVVVEPNDHSSVTVRLNPNPGSIRGAVTDAHTSDPIGGAAISLVGTEIATTSNESGEFVLAEVPRGTYTLRAQASGYAAGEKADVIVTAGSTTSEDLELSPVTGRVQGMVRDALNGDAVGGATLVLDGSTQTSADNGTYAFEAVRVGSHVMEVSADGFESTQVPVEVIDERTHVVHVNLSPALSDDQLRIVLSWGNSPRDLDAHLWLPAPRYYHVHYQSRGDLDSCPYSSLDLDDTNGEGPETITIDRSFAGTYRYGVHDFTNQNEETTSTALGSSGARVDVFSQGGLEASFDVPPGVGVWWHAFDAVFDADASEWVIQPVDTLSSDSPAPYSQTNGCQ